MSTRNCITKFFVVVALCAFTFHLSPFTLSAQPTAHQKAQDSVVRIEVPGGPSVEMVYVEGGTFTMGSNSSSAVANQYDYTRPEHQVSVGSFYIGRFEVTQGLWSAVMGENGSQFRGSDLLPVEQVSWEEARQFVTLLSQMTGRRFRVPTEAEWEYAARGGAESGERRVESFAFAGCNRNGLDSCAWYCVNSGGRTHEVGGLAPNELGLYDMSGNVAEWCADWMAPYGADDVKDPQGPRDGDSRIVRGGHYYSTSSGCAVFDRGWYVPTGKTEYYGLRLVMEIEQ